MLKSDGGCWMGRSKRAQERKVAAGVKENIRILLATVCRLFLCECVEWGLVMKTENNHIFHSFLLPGSLSCARTRAHTHTPKDLVARMVLFPHPVTTTARDPRE